MKKTLQIGAWVTVIILCAMSAIPCPAADTAILQNGFSIRHERRQVIGTMTRLYVNADGSSFVDIPTAEIDHFEVAADEPASQVTQVKEQAKKDIGRPVNLNEVVAAASGTYRLDPDLVNSVIRAESGFNTRAVSPKGAQGLMQLMPQTASQLGVRNAFDPQANVEGGTRYLRELLERYDFDLIKALAAYNAGPQRVEQYGGVPPYYETKAYVARIVRDFNKKKLASKAAEKNSSPTTFGKSASKKPAGSSAQSAKPHSSATQARAKTPPTPASD